MCKSESIRSYLRSSALSKWRLVKFISSWGLSKEWMITVYEEKCTSFNLTP